MIVIPQISIKYSYSKKLCLYRVKTKIMDNAPFVRRSNFWPGFYLQIIISDSVYI